MAKAPALSIRLSLQLRPIMEKLAEREGRSLANMIERTLWKDDSVRALKAELEREPKRGARG